MTKQNDIFVGLSYFPMRAQQKKQCLFGIPKIHSITCNVSSSVLVRVLLFNVCFNLLLHLWNKEVRLARQWNHVVDDI